MNKDSIILNKIYTSGELATDFYIVIFVAIPKNPMAADCKDHRTTSLPAHLVKLLLRIVLARIWNKLDNEVAKEHDGFWKTIETRKGIFMLWTICERSILTQQDVSLLHRL